MERESDIRLLELMWRFGIAARRDFISFSGQHVGVVYCGEYHSDTHSAAGAEVVIDGVVSRGDVIFGDGDDLLDRAVLHVVSEPCIPLHDSRGNPICQICIEVDDLIRERYETLLGGIGEAACAETIARMDDLHRTDFYTGLALERMKRKSDEIKSLYEASDFDWAQTLYVMMMRSLGDNKNKEPFTEIARRVPFVTLMREKSSVRTVEALLMGMSGLLLEYDADDYVVALSQDFEYMCHKYSLRPLKPAEWTLGRINPQNHPIMRLAEFAALVCSSRFVFSAVLECRTAADIVSLLSAEASDYWQTHFLPGRESRYTRKKIGTDKAYLIGINLIAPFLFAYADARGDENGRVHALELLESMPPESNGITRKWAERGAVMRNAFDSQAVLQLNNELCGRKLCDECLLGRRQIKKSIASLR